MEEAVKSIESLAKHILPTKPHCLSIHATRRYRPHPDEKRLEEQDFRPLQYKTFVSDADRGVTLTRAYFDIREEPTNLHNATPQASTPRTDPSKPVTKLSLKDYKNRAKGIDNDSTPKPRPPSSSHLAVPKAKPPSSLSKHAPDTATKDMENPGPAKKSVPSAKPEVPRRPSPSPETKKRVPAREEDGRPAKRIKGEDATPNALPARPLKNEMPGKLERKISHEKKPSKELKPVAGGMTNGRSALGSLNNRSASPKPLARVNGAQKSVTTNNTPKKSEGNSHSQTSSVPPLLSPLRIAGLDPRVEGSEPVRASPKKKVEESNNTKLPPKKSREEREPSPTPKKRKLPLKVPPLLSPTLPPIVMEELAKAKKTTPSKDSSQRSSQGSPQPTAQKTVKSAKREEPTIHVDSKKDDSKKDELKKEEPDSYIVTMKYKKRYAKTLERLLALPPGGRRKAEGLKKEERSVRDRSDSLEPGVARKRPRAAADAHPTESSKRPRTSENLQPSTPLPRQSASMTRVASSSSLAGTPSAANDLTPSTQPPTEQRRSVAAPVDFEQVRKLQSKSKTFRELGTRLKHERDAIMRRETGPPDHDQQTAMGAGTQSLLAYMLSFKLEADARDLEQKARAHAPWKELMPLIRVIRNDCRNHHLMSAVLVRIQGICLVYLARALLSYPNQPEAVRDLVQCSKEQQDIWRQADKARRALGVYDGGSGSGSGGSSDGGPVGKLIDRLGPWSSPEDATPIIIEILRKTIRTGGGSSSGQWRPAEELAKFAHILVANGSSS